MPHNLDAERGILATIILSNGGLYADAAAKRLRVSMTSLQEFFGNKPVAHIFEGEIEDYKTVRLRDAQVRGITLRHDLHALSAFFRYAVKQRWARRNPVMNVNKPSDAGSWRQNRVSNEEFKKYLAVARRDVHDVAVLMFNQGLRPSEALALRKDDLDLITQGRARLRIRAGKSKAARRELPLTSESARLLAYRMMTPGPWVFPSKRLPGEHVKELEEAHELALQRSGVNFVLYDLRA